MELPIASQSYVPSDAALIRAAHRALADVALTIADAEPFEGGIAYRSEAYPGEPMACFAAELTKPSEGEAGENTGESPVDRVVTSMDEAFGEATCQAAFPASGQWDDDLKAALLARGFATQARQLLLLQRYRRPEAMHESLQVIPARAAYPAMRELYAARAEQSGARDRQAHARMRIDLLDEPRLELFLGRLDRKPVGVVGVVTLGNIGVLHEVYTLPEYRKQGIATTLMAHTLDHCERALFEQVIMDLPASPSGGAPGEPTDTGHDQNLHSPEAPEDPENAALLAFLTELGFAEVARYEALVRQPG